MPRLATAFIFAADAGRLARFYESGFGVEFAIHQIPAEIAKDIVIADPPHERATGSTKLVFAVEDFATAKTRLEAAGARFRDNPWDGETARDFVDPEGNVARIRQE